MLETLPPGIPRTLRIDAKLADALEDQAQLRLRATLRVANVEPIELGAAVHQVASRPRFSAETSQFVAENDEVLRPNRITACKLVLRNEGTDRGRDVRVRLQLPEELHLDRADGAVREGDTVVLGDIPAGETRESTIFLRLAGQVAQDEELEVSGARQRPQRRPVLARAAEAEHVMPKHRSPRARRSTSHPADAIDAGAPVAYTLALRNCGDGAAKRLTIRLDSPATRCTRREAPVRQRRPAARLRRHVAAARSAGLTLGDVGVGAEVIVHLQAIVNAPLPSGTAIETRAYIAWDDGAETIVRCRAAARPLDAGAARSSRRVYRSPSSMPPPCRCARRRQSAPPSSRRRLPANGNGHPRDGHTFAIPAVASEPAQLEPAPTEGPTILSLAA